MSYKMLWRVCVALVIIIGGIVSMWLSDVFPIVASIIFFALYWHIGWWKQYD
jgi:hypothetical protein